MSGFQRKGTVSKSSGPVHVNSYALKGVPIKYTSPFFLPDQLTLPASWTLPKLPSDVMFRYDYSREKAVLEQVRVRTMSLAAEAQAREQREKEEEEKRRIEAAAAAERAKVTSSSAELPPPLIPSPGSTILTPKPAPQHTITKSPPTNGANNSASPNIENSSSRQTNILVKDSHNVFKPLGEMSLSEFEDDNFNPFDATSLQAINDMEILQTISLAPIPNNATTSPPRMNTSSGGQTGIIVSGPRTTLSGSTACTSSPANSDGMRGLSSQQIPIQFAGPPAPLPTIGSHSQPAFIPSSVANIQVPGSVGTNPHQLNQTPSSHLPNSSSIPHSFPSLPVLPPIGNDITHSHSEPANTNIPSSNPSLIPPPSTQPLQTPPLSTNPVHSTPAMYPPMSQGTVTLNPPPPTSLSSSPPIAIGSTGPPPHSAITPYPSLPPQRTSLPNTHQLPHALSSSPSGHTPYLHVPPQPVGGGGAVSGAVEQGGDVGALVNLRADGGSATTPFATSAPQQVSPTQTRPVPKPRTVKTAPVVGQQVPNNAHPYPAAPVPLPRAPAVGPKPAPASSSVQARANSLLASLPQPTAACPGLGVPVLPPISTTPHQSPPVREHSAPSHPSTSTPPSFPNPPYLPPYTQSSANRSNSPPPPYYSGQDETTRRFSQPVLPSQQHAPSHYTLPDPQSSVSTEEKMEVESIASMGFPAPRVARAVKRFNNNRTKVVDFLILVGSLEESTGSKGDSAEVALTVCDGNDTKAKRYLQKVKYYRESGFSEKSIHEAYETAGKDWDRALDILTRNTAS